MVRWSRRLGRGLEVGKGYVNEIEMALSRVSLFATLPRDELEYLAATLQPVEVTPGALLFHEGDYGDLFYVVSAGQVEVIKALGTAEERVVGVRGAGDFVGEMSLFDVRGQRTASVRAADQTRLLEMKRGDFDALLHRQPTLAYEMVRVLSERLNASQNNAIRDLQEKNRQLVQAYEELKAAQAQVIEKEKLERELQVAHNIQMSILPRRLPKLAGLDFGSQILPMMAVGGDFYDFILLDDGMLGIAVGDVSGHGVPAALFMALTVTLLRAEACHDCSPVHALRAVNRQLLSLNSEGMFVTVLYGVLDCVTREFAYARAGHELPVLCNAEGELSELHLGPGQPLGLFEAPVLDEQTLTIPPEGTLLLYTDGVSEARDTRGAMFGEERLRGAVTAHRHSSAQQVCDQVLEQVMAHSGAETQYDDIAVVCVRAK
jgi:sigma-B regulation protein RsbU (phosphoserine phosphatase)